MAAYSVHDSSYFSRRAIVLIVSVAVQVVIFIALDYGLVNKVFHAPPAPIQTSIVQQQQKKVAPPPPPPPRMRQLKAYVPPPEVTINVPTATRPTAITEVTSKKAPPPPKPRPAPVVYRPATLNLRDSPPTGDYYPPVSRRLDEQGTTIVRACPGPNGRLAAPPTVVHSSGSPRLDRAALRWTRHARFNPGTANGKPVEVCTEFRVVFRLEGGGGGGF